MFQRQKTDSRSIETGYRRLHITLCPSWVDHRCFMLASFAPGKLSTLGMPWSADSTHECADGGDAPCHCSEVKASGSNAGLFFPLSL